MERLYFKWEDGPAVVDPVGKGYEGYFIAPGGAEWTLAMPSQVADFLIDGEKMSETDFEAKFGVVGKDLPEPPIIK